MFDFVIQKTRCCSSFRRRFEILFCCLVMCLGVCVPAWAAEEYSADMHFKKNGVSYSYHFTGSQPIYLIKYSYSHPNGAYNGFFYFSLSSVTGTTDCPVLGSLESSFKSLSGINFYSNGYSGFDFSDFDCINDLGTLSSLGSSSYLPIAVDMYKNGELLLGNSGGPDGPSVEYSGESITDSITNYYTHHYLSGHTSGTAVIEFGAPYLFVQQPHENTLYEWFISDSLFSVSGDFLIENGEPFLTEGYYMRGQTLSAGLDFSRLDSRVVVIPADFKGTPIDYVKQYGFPTGGSGGEPSDYAYDSAIPAPQNLKLDFIKTSVGILGFSKRTDLQLSWTNALVDEYSVQISASITAEFTPGEGNQTHGKKTFTHKLVGLSQVDSGGPDSGYPASSGKYAITEDDLKAIAEDYLPDGPHVLERAYVDSFRVQFYKIDSGAVNVGPIAVVNLTYSVLGKYQGSTTTIEYPKDSADIGGGGLMPDDSDKWGGDGSGWEYDEDGNVTGSTGGSGSESWTDVLNGLLNSLLNIPTVIARLFDSLSSMMSGMSGLSGFIVQLFGFLPPDIVSLITLAIPIVIVLRIVGR